MSLDLWVFRDLHNAGLRIAIKKVMPLILMIIPYRFFLVLISVPNQRSL